MATDADITHETLEGRQRRGHAWAIEVYGDRAKGARYQAFRSLEEMMELCQTQGLTFEDFVRTARYVSDRKVGDTKTEIGDTTLCLSILAENLGLSLDSCLASTLVRVQGLDKTKARAKDDAKIAYGLI